MRSIFDNKTNTILSRGDLKRGKYQAVYWVMFAILVLLSLICIIPVFWILMSCFKSTQEIFSATPSFFPREWNTDGLAEAWEKLQLWPNILSTVVLSVGNLLISLVVCGLGGYVLSRLRPVGHKLIFTLVIWTMMMPAQVRIVPLYMSFIDFPIGGFSLVDSYVPLWLITAANCFNIMLFKNHFDTISISLVEASKLDGCGDIRTFFHVIVPLSVPIIMFVGISCVNISWSEFFWSMLVLDDANLQTIPVRIFKLSADTSITMKIYMVALLFACIPPFIIFLIFQRQIVGGINVGGVKG